MYRYFLLFFWPLNIYYFTINIICCSFIGCGCTKPGYIHITIRCSLPVRHGYFISGSHRDVWKMAGPPRKVQLDNVQRHCSLRHWNPGYDLRNLLCPSWNYQVRNFSFVILFLFKHHSMLVPITYVGTYLKITVRPIPIGTWLNHVPTLPTSCNHWVFTWVGGLDLLPTHEKNRQE